MWLPVVLWLVGCVLPAHGQPENSQGPQKSSIVESSLPPGYVARINLNQPAEVLAILKRAEALFDASAYPEGVPPVVMVLHGPEIDMFSRANYSRFQGAVDLAAKLSALDVIDVRICETRLAERGLMKSDLLPFVGTVPFGPAEERRLIDRDFVYF